MESTSQIEIINKNDSKYEITINLPFTFGSFMIFINNKYYCSTNHCSINYNNKLFSIDTTSEIHGTQESICGRCELIYDEYENQLLLQLMDPDIFKEIEEESLKYTITVIY